MPCKQKKRLPPKVYAEFSRYIDPLNAGSLISYVITRDKYEYFNATLTLTDCSRKIGWGFELDGDPLVKLAKAIEALQFFEKDLKAAIAQQPKKKDKQ